tara:strand:+ start:3172 stop:3828 length:657 start_codon:yes stop_codon:yes gene_type:complete
MSVPVFQATIVNGVGDLLPAATITVLVEATGQPAVIYSDRNGTVPLGTLGVFSVDAEAFAQFFAAPGNYRVTANDSGSGFSRTWDYVVLTGTAGTADLGLLAGNALAADDINANGDVWGASNVIYVSNANGEYWQYPDGLLIMAINESGSGAGFKTITLPRTIIVGYKTVLSSNSSSSATSLAGKSASPTSSTLGIAIVSTGGYETSGIGIQIIGRWK